MQSVLKVTNSEGDQQPVGDSTAANIQTTQTTDPSAIQNVEQPAKTSNNAAIDLLSSEASGAVHDGSTVQSNKNSSLVIGGTIIVTAVAVSILWAFYIKHFRNNSSKD